MRTRKLHCGNPPKSKRKRRPFSPSPSVMRKAMTSLPSMSMSQVTAFAPASIPGRKV